MIKFIPLVMFLLLYGCSMTSNQENIPLINNDPFTESLKGKGLRTAIISDSGSPAVTDTIRFNQDGSIASETETYSLRRYGYDSNGNLKRLLSINDNPSNYVISYEREGNVIFQSWYQLDHLNWEYKKEDLDTADRLVKFKFDESKNLREELNLTIGEVTRYEYVGSNIQSKQVFLEGADTPSIKWTYRYNDKGFLERAECISQGKLINEHFFGDDGLIDSTRRIGYTLLYNYEYY